MTNLIKSDIICLKKEVVSVYFESEEQLFLYLKNHTTVLGSGSIGITFLNSSGKNVLKIFRSVTDDYYQDDYKKEDILRDSSIKTKNIIFPRF